jgi:hypothetical protein
MLVIRPEQMKRLEEYVEDNFIRSLALTVRDEHGDMVDHQNDDELRKLVRVAVARARRHGLMFESSISVFVGLMFEFAPNFDEQPSIRKILSDESLPPDDRIDVVLEVASEEDWAEAERLYNEYAWFDIDTTSQQSLRDEAKDV